MPLLEPLISTIVEAMDALEAVKEESKTVGGRDQEIAKK